MGEESLSFKFNLTDFTIIRANYAIK